MTVLLANAPTRIDLGHGKERFFVKAGSRWPFSIEKSPTEPCRYVPFPFSLAYVGALLEKESIPVEAFDGVALNTPRATFLDRAATYRPTVILMETTTPTVEHDLALCRDLKARTGALIALGGAHATTFARELLEKHPEVDWVVRGEYEFAFVEAVRAHLAGDAAALGQVAGLVFRRVERAGAPAVVVENAPPKPIEPLDLLPFPARHLFPTRQAPTTWPYWDGFCRRRPAVQMHASRGCPFRCTFCLWVSVVYESGPYRTFSAKRVVDEMEHSVRELGAKEIYFDDDIFTAKEAHVLAVCDEICARGLEVPWSVMGDAMAVTEKSIDAMARAGCIGMKFGIESANAEVLKRARKPLKLDKVQRVVGWCAQRAIKTHATITFGLEGETRASMEETLAFCRALPVDSIQFSVATPFPGTPYYKNVVASGRLKAGADWTSFDGARSGMVLHEGLTGDEVAEFVRLAPSRWLRAKLRDPSWLRRQVRYFGEIARDQGLKGIERRAVRGVRLLTGQLG